MIYILKKINDKKKDKKKEQYYKFSNKTFVD